MKIFIVLFICLIAVHSREYHYEKPNVGFPQEDFNRALQAQQSMIIPGQYGRNYEVTMVPSKKLFETRVQQETQQHFQQNLNAQHHQLPAVTQPGNVQPYSNINHPQNRPLTSPNPGFFTNAINGNLQTPSNHQYSGLNQPQPGLNANQYASRASNSFTANGAQQHLNQYSNINQQQQQQHYQQQGGNFGAQQSGVFSQQQQQSNNGNSNNHLQNSNNLLYDLVNNNKYVSQSEASQLDVYPYKQLTIGNTRPFTRIITKCDAKGNCEQQNAADGGDFQHQQVLKQSRAKVEPISDKCRKYDYSPNSLNSQNSQNKQNSQTGNYPAGGNAAKGASTRKGTDLRDRRLFPYSEQVIPQYPTN